MQQSIIAVSQLLVYALVYCLPMHYLHFIPFISFTYILYWVRAECRLTMSSPALNFTNSVIFLIEFGWFVFTTCMLSLKLPWPIMPNFTHISSSGIAPPCYMSTLSVTWGNSQNGPVFQAVNIGHPLYRGGWLATPPILCRMGVGQIGSLAGPPPQCLIHQHLTWMVKASHAAVWSAMTCLGSCHTAAWWYLSQQSCCLFVCQSTLWIVWSCYALVCIYRLSPSKSLSCW